MDDLPMSRLLCHTQVKKDLNRQKNKTMPFFFLTSFAFRPDGAFLASLHHRFGSASRL
jgi:methyltransferase-like protein